MIYKVEGFTFETEEEARLAGREAEGIKYIRSRNDMDDPDAVLKLYNRLIEKEIFVTPVGIGFLEELHSYLLTIPYIREEELFPLPVFKSKKSQVRTAAQEKTVGSQQLSDEKTEGGTGSEENKKIVPVRTQSERDYRKPFLVSTFFAIVFGIALVGIFIIIVMSTNNVTILNYQNQLIDRYEQWEMELNQRESELREREKELENRTAAVQEANP